MLCAAVHSPKREVFIKAVLTLNALQQDALAQSIRRTTVEDLQVSVLAPVTPNDENVIAAETNSPDVTHEKSLDKISEPSGIPLADYKALAAERDGLRRKLAAAEFERNTAVEVAEGLKSSLEEASDKVRVLEAKEETQRAELETKSSALQESKKALRDAHNNAEEIDVLRAKAASAEQLEASLKRASKRLEEVAEMRKGKKDLEAQILAFRENEEQMAKHAEYLESQLRNSNERGQQLATLSDTLSAEIENKENELTQLKAHTAELKNKLNTTNQQLTSMMLQSTNTTSQSKGTSSKSTDNEANNKSLDAELPVSTEEIAGETASASDSQKEATSEPLKPESVKEMVSDTLYDEIGVRMEWKDIVECVRGVMDALREMDEMEGTQHGSLQEMNSRNSSHMSDSLVQGDRSVHSSSQSLRSEAYSHHPDIGSDSESRMSLLPEFGELDSSLAAAHGGKGDEFDHAATHTNVQEIALDVPVQRRRSSQLATIPENREGFDANGSEIYDQDTSYGSGYLTEGDEPADETVNATISSSQVHLPGQIVDAMNAERKSSPSDSKDMSATQPDSPLIATDFVPTGKEIIETQVRSTPVGRSHSLTKDLRKSASLSLSVRSGTSRTPSASETTRSLVRQAKNELSALQKAVEMMRTERQSSTSIGALVQQLDVARRDLSACQTSLRETEKELHGAKKELGAVLREMDSLSAQRKIEKDREAKLLDEKERLLGHLQDSLKQKDGIVASHKDEIQSGLQEIEKLRSSEKSLEEKLQAARVIERAHELEITRLTAQIEANNLLSNRLSAVMDKTDGIRDEITTQREGHLQQMAAEAKREKQLAEEARDEAKRVARNQENVLEDVRATAAAVAARKNISELELRIHSRKSRFSDFWRRLLHREKVNIDYTMPASTTSIPVALDRSPRKKPSLARSQ